MGKGWEVWEEGLAPVMVILSSDFSVSENGRNGLSDRCVNGAMHGSAHFQP